MIHLPRNKTSRVAVLRALYLAAFISLLVTVTSQSYAAGEHYALIVHGGETTHASYANGRLRVDFRHSPHPAGDPLHYEEQVPRGQAAWPDRRMESNEPGVLYQTMSEQDAARVIKELNAGGYWKFFCENTNRGYFDVSRSEITHSAMRID